jgi:cytochrome P450
VFRRAADGQIRRRRAMADPGDDLLGLLLKVRDEETGQALSDVDIRDTLMTFVAAGHETTAIALTWALYLVANDPECQAALRAEADAVFGTGTPGADEAGRLILHRQVIEEALRLFPPAPILGRRALADCEICGRPVKKGDVALLAFYALHRHETLWDHPGKFDPGRWSQERRPRDRYMFMAFGGGPRACIGAQFAMMEAVIVLSTILSRLTVAPAHGAVKPVMQVTLRPEGGMPLIFAAR